MAPLPLPADTLLTGVTSITARSGWIAGRGPDGEPRILRREEGTWRAAITWSNAPRPR